MKPGDNKTGFDNMLRRGLSSDSTQAAQGCPDTHILAAYYERSLAPAEIEQFDTHLATCARCRAQIAALVRSEPRDEKALVAPATWLWNWRWLAPAVTAIAIVLIWAGIRSHNKTIKEPVNVAMTQTTAPLEPVPPPTQPQLAPPSRTVAGDGLAEHAAIPNSEKKFSGSSPRGFATQSREAPMAPSGHATAGEPPSLRGEGVGASSAGGVAGGAGTSPPPPDDSALSATLAQSAPGDVASTANRNATRLAAPQASGAGAATAKREFSLSAKRPVSAPQAKASSTTADQLQVREESPSPIVIRSPDATKSWRIAASGAIEFSGDSGVTWEMQRPEIVGAMMSGFAPSAKICWIVGRGGAVLRTVNGTDWKQVAAPTSQDLTSVIAWSAKRAQVTAADASVFVTKDGGKSWTQQNNP